ncbi:glycosyltransferase [Flavitalea sp. BT771]|uniref:glycosyltransferase family 2 protein n=1 Tax=Flavitalea sp. BT771 TaxID=3063329 RepID=UPI0026E47CD4|nr:glycosyltransferase [Flavitalea sp. BT771]MDO6432552.1 glycosyltransferase [Flavitalea sp. BT771]MDV6221461.1 glycosyltransferase [Flavitalea sp. BT771]
MKANNTIRAPSRTELLSIRIMVILGLVAMGYFLYTVYQAGHDRHTVLYWLLLFTIVFTCIRIVLEWVHYIFITVPPTPPLEREFTVDIFTTYCPGEPLAMIEETLIAITQIRYPHTTYLCDEANDPYLKDLCGRLGIQHVTRNNRKDAKAGNINNALKQSSGELCVVLDPDHVPFPEFLDPIVSQFNDPSIGFVQIVQAYKNSRATLIAKGASQQTYQFYGPMMMTMNKYGTVQAIGANCTFRRTALDSIGGHAAGLAEDMNTAMHLHAKGWRSVYVPRVLARGLVPSSLSAYYKQQLKWSRGVFELLFTTYPKLFRQFTWRQKLHYGLGSFYYLSGIVFLINLLIPMLFLLDLSTTAVGFERFMISIFPLIVAIFLIRHFVQNWVMEDEERGFHVVGGLLMIGTWWIYILGFVFAVFRIKVPYDPTPKEDEKSDSWRLNFPNILVILLSALAIIYGLVYDWNPYSIGMAGFAALNCLIMLFTVAASRQQRFRAFRNRHPGMQFIMRHVATFKLHFWRLRRRIYSGVRIAALPLLAVTIGITLYILELEWNKGPGAMSVPGRKDIFLTGIFSPGARGSITPADTVAAVRKRYQRQLDIVSLYLPWGDRRECDLPVGTMDSIYRQGSLSMITWEPWQTLFDGPERPPTAEKEKKIFQRIVQGKYDGFLDRFCKELKTFARPVFLRFAHEADNPFYPWSPTGGNTAAEFTAAWKYVHDYFGSRNVLNVIWVWNPWKATAADDYFPGAAYVDWIGVTILNYGRKNPDSTWYAMRELYDPFHKKAIFQSGLPVMITELGSLPSEGRQLQWFTEAFHAVKTYYPEIKGLVFFDNSSDKNTPSGDGKSPLNWTGIDRDSVFLLTPQHKHFSGLSYGSALTPMPEDTSRVFQHIDGKQLFTGLRGIGYSRGQNWYGNRRAFRWNELVKDFTEIKQLGINTIKHYGPGIYDHNILRAAGKMDIKIQYGFWIPNGISFTGDNAATLMQLRRKIVATVRKLKEDGQIISWNIGNTTYQSLGSTYYKPDVNYQRDAYLSWLQELIADVRKEDSLRPITIDVAATSSMPEAVEMIHARVPCIAGFGLVINERDTSFSLIGKLKRPWFYGNVTAAAYLRLPSSQAGTFISNWKDDEATDIATLDGLLDSHDRRKPDYYELRQRWTGSPGPDTLPEIKILRTASPTEKGADLAYSAIVPSGNGWRIASPQAMGLRFEWYLVLEDAIGTPINISSAGTGARVVITIPPNPSLYKVYLYTIKGTDVKVVHTSLNTPLQNDYR